MSAVGEWRAWFDGSALPNPGKLGIGLILNGPDGEHIEQSMLAGFHGCNNEAELFALCTVLDLAWREGARHIHVCGDSDIAVRYVNGLAHTGIPRLQVLIVRAQAAMAQFDHAQLQWVPRHRNQEADRFSRAALGLVDKPNNPNAHKQRKKKK